MKKFLIILLTFSILSNVFGQNIILKDSIFIDGNVSFFSPDSTKINTILLKNRQNRDIDFLPVFCKNLTIQDGLEIKNISLINAKYNVINDEILKGIYNADKITNEPQIKASISIYRKSNVLDFEIMPIRKNSITGQTEILSYFECSIEFSQKREKNNSRTYAYNSNLSSGKWYKIKVANSGIYKITYEQLVEMGFSNFGSIGIFGYGGSVSKTIKDNNPLYFTDIYIDDIQERPIMKVDANENGNFDSGDYILFYADGPHNINYSLNGFNHDFHNYSDYSYYFVSNKGTWKNPINAVSESTSNKSVVSYDKYMFLEKDSISIAKTGRTMYWRSFDYYVNMDATFSERNIANDSATAFFHFAANSALSSYFDVTINNSNRKRMAIAASSANGNDLFDFIKFKPSGSNTNIAITYTKTTSTAKGWIDYIALQLRKNLVFENGYITFRDIKSVGIGNIAEFTISQSPSNIVLWDISDRINCKKIIGEYSSNTYKFRANAESLKEYVAFNPQYSFPSPIYVGSEDIGVIENQNLHALGNADLIIISHPNFLSQASEIKNLHETMDNMNVVIATPQKIYNEFSSGSPDISAIRNFIKMFYDRAPANKIPKNVLLLGDGSYDNKTNDGSVSNYILTYETVNSLTNTLSITSDDFFVCLDEGEGNIEYNEKMDMGIGRMPVKTSEEATIAVNKIKEYYNSSSFGNWKNKIVLIADDAENNETVHQINTENMIATQFEYMAKYLNIEKIYMDDYEQVYSTSGSTYPEVNQAIIDNINNGALIVNWVGHGNPKGWGHENIFTFNSISSLQNKSKYPLIVTATCDFSPFDDHTFLSGGEQLFLRKESGAIALFTTVRQVYSTKNERLVTNFYKYMFMNNLEEYNLPKPYTLGECVALGKNETGDFNMRSFTLLGDPAITISQAKYSVKTSKINDIPITEFSDTIGATGLVTIEGMIYDDNGNFAENYNGTVYPSVYDKRNVYTTKSNDGSEPLTYTAQRNIIFNGQSTVKNGKFKFSFIVPIDIAYYFDYGKISYYSNNKINIEAKGYDNSFIVGGTDKAGVKDSEGPIIDLYMNDENFIDGGIVNENPLLLAKITDESGINTIGNGIGHDITLTIDGNSSNTKVLNSFYESEIDNYQSGTVSYPNSGIAIGQHILNVKAWDVLNNSSEKSIDFIVANSSELVIDKLFNYPNPFSTNTSFYFGHNQPYQNLEVIITIFTISGKLVKTLEATMFCDGYLSNPIEWNGRDEYDGKLAKGVYIYRVKVRNDNGSTIDKFEKLVILN